MTHTKDHTGHSHTYEIKVSSLFESVKTFFKMLRDKLDIFPYTSGKQLKPYHQTMKGRDYERLNHTLMQSRMYLR